MGLEEAATPTRSPSRRAFGRVGNTMAEFYDDPVPRVVETEATDGESDTLRNRRAAGQGLEAGF